MHGPRFLHSPVGNTYMNEIGEGNIDTYMQHKRGWGPNLRENCWVRFTRCSPVPCSRDCSGKVQQGNRRFSVREAFPHGDHQQLALSFTSCSDPHPHPSCSSPSPLCGIIKHAGSALLRDAEKEVCVVLLGQSESQVSRLFRSGAVVSQSFIKTGILQTEKKY